MLKKEPGLLKKEPGLLKKAMLKPTLVRSSSVESVMVPACPVMVNNGASRTLRVALAMYGLVRHPCPEANIARVFFQPLRKVEGFNFQIDTFVATNVLTHAEEGGRPGAKVGSYEVVAQSEFMNFNSCHSSVLDQEAVDYDTRGLLNATCGTYGDAWGDKTCRTTHNFLTALHAQRRVSQLIRAHEQHAQFQYDVVVVARVDVLFTSSIPDGIYAEVAAHAVDKKETIVTPNWATFGGANDRFALATRGAALMYLERLDRAAAYCSSHQRLHSESFTLWQIRQMNATVHKQRNIRLRRVRGNGWLSPAGYKVPEAESKCVLHLTKTCSVEEVAKVGVCGDAE